MTNNCRTVRPIRAAVLALAAGTAIGLATAESLAGPQGSKVVHGSAQITRNGNQTVIRAADKTILNHKSFDIGRNESVRFIQPNRNSRVLNRITGSAPTKIDGALIANGQVYIVNPAGVFFGAGSVVDVGALYAGAASISNNDFLAGVNRFTNVTGEVIAEGMITADAVHLIGQRVANHGTIVADGGMATMLVGDEVYLRNQGGRILVRIDGQDVDTAAGPRAGDGRTAPDASAVPAIENTGTIRATRGTITLGAGDAYSLAMRNTGRISAGGGEITLSAADGAIHNKGEINASVGQGRAGSVTIQAARVAHEGLAAADSGAGKAGSVEITSSRSTVLADGSVVSAAGGSGNAAGGQVLVHAYQGDTFVESGARIDISGGDAGGNGGFAEVSAARRLGLFGQIEGEAAPGYAAASVLLDPQDIYIWSGKGGNQDDGQLDDGQVLAGDGLPDDIFQISAYAIESFEGDVTLEATRDIFVQEDINKTNGGLVLDAGRDLVFGYQGDNGPRGQQGGFMWELTISADHLDFTAGRNIVDRVVFQTQLNANVGDISLAAITGSIETGQISVPAGRTVMLTQAESMYIGWGPYGFLANPESTNLVVRVTDGYLVFGGDFGGVSGEQYIASVDAEAREFLRVEDDLYIGDFADLRSFGNVEIDGLVHATSRVSLHGGMDGSGDVLFVGPNLSLAGDVIRLRAGSDTGLATSKVDVITNEPMFYGAPIYNVGQSVGARPSSFSIEQDAPLASLPAASQFGGPLDGMLYRAESYDASVLVSDASTVAGTALTLASETGSTMTQDLNLESLRVIGASRLAGHITTITTQTYEGAVTLDGDRTLTGTTIAAQSTIDALTAGEDGLVVVGDLTIDNAVGGNAALENLRVTGTSRLAGDVTTLTTQTYEGAATIVGGRTLTGSLVTVGSGLDALAAGEDGLLVIGDLLANGAIGGERELEYLAVGGASRLNADVSTTGEQSYGGAVTIAGDRTLTGSLITTGSTVDAANAGADALLIDGDLAASDAIGGAAALETLTVTGASYLMGDVTTAGTQNYNGAVTLSGHRTLSGTTINAGSTIDGDAPATARGVIDGPDSLVVAGDLDAAGEIGGNVALESLRVTGTSRLAGNVTTVLEQTYEGAVTIDGDLTLAGTTILAESTIDGAAAAQDALVIDGNLIAGDDIGGSAILESLHVTGASRLGGDVTTDGAQRYDGAITLDGDRTLTGTVITANGDVNAANAGEDALTVQGDLVANGDVGAFIALEALTVNGSTDLNGGAVITRGDQRYNGAVRLGVENALTSLEAGTIRFGGTVDGGHDLTATTSEGGLIVFAGDVGMNEALRDIRLSTAGADGVRAIPDRATIVGENSISIRARDFAMGQHEKFTTLGSLDLRVTRNAELGDLVTTGDMRVDAQQITFLRRAASTLLNDDGQLVEDRGLDFVSGGTMLFTGEFVLGGDASGANPTFASASGPRNINMPADWEFRAIDGELTSIDALTLADGTVLDQKTTPAPVDPPIDPPPPTEPPIFGDAAALAGATQSPEFEDSIQPDVFDVDLLTELAIAARSPNREEAAAALAGRLLYNDLPGRVIDYPGDRTVAATRMDINEVIAVVNTYRGLFGEGGAQSAAVGERLSASVESFRAASGNAFDAAEYRLFLETSPEQAPTLATVQQISSLLAGIRGLGLSGVEYKQTRDRLLAGIAGPAGLTPAQFAPVVEPTAPQAAGAAQAARR